MNQSKIREAAENLDGLLQKYERIDQEVRALRGAVSALISDALLGNVTRQLNVNSIPGSFFFNEGHLRKYSDIEEAFVKFKIELTGGKNSVISRLAQQMEAREQTATQAKPTGSGKVTSDQWRRS